MVLLLRRVGSDDASRASTRRALAQSLYPIVVQARAASRDLALIFYDQQRAEHTTARPTLHVAEPEYPVSALAEELDRVQREYTPERLPTAAAAMTVRHVEQAGRETIARQARADPAAKAWARGASGRETCAFCGMLIGRGAVYRSAAFSAHDHCDCLAVPVFTTAEWPGRADHLHQQQLWNAATKGLSGKAALAAYRKAYRDDKRGTEAVPVLRAA